MIRLKWELNFGEVRVTMAGIIELQVEEFGQTLLEYKFNSVTEASEMLSFLKDFFPLATYLIQPVRH